jgi:hypothetical protein
MPRRKPRPPAAALPFVLWTDLAMRTGEMLVASAQVIGHRTGRMATAGPSPNARDRKEFSRMGLEKVAAANESALAMGRQLAAAQMQLGLSAWKSLCEMSQVSATVTKHGLKPIHSRATANAKRLGRLK